MAKQDPTNALGTPKNPITEADTHATLPWKHCKCSICAQVVRCTPTTDVYRCDDGKLRCTPCNDTYTAKCADQSILNPAGRPDPSTMN